MIVVLAIDGLEITLVEQFGCRALMQEYHGRTDISEFSEPRTVVLWSSFLAGRNTEKEVLALGKEKMWSFALKKEETFLAGFEAPCVIDLPAYCYDQRQHGEERRLLREYFTADGDRRGEILRRYNDLAFAHHRKIKAEFEEALKQNHDIVIGYFSLADVVGHLNFGNRTMMRLVYKEFDEIAQKVRSEIDGAVLVISDHGMKAVGVYGDHSDYGFWSSNMEDLGRPRLSQFASIIPRWR